MIVNTVLQGFVIVFKIWRHNGCLALPGYLWGWKFDTFIKYYSSDAICMSKNALQWYALDTAAVAQKSLCS